MFFAEDHVTQTQRPHRTGIGDNLFRQFAHPNTTENTVGSPESEAVATLLRKVVETETCARKSLHSLDQPCPTATMESMTRECSCQFDRRFVRVPDALFAHVTRFHRAACHVLLTVTAEHDVVEMHPRVLFTQHVLGHELHLGAHPAATEKHRVSHFGCGAESGSVAAKSFASSRKHAGRLQEYAFPRGGVLVIGSSHLQRVHPSLTRVHPSLTKCTAHCQQGAPKDDRAQRTTGVGGFPPWSARPPPSRGTSSPRGGTECQAGPCLQDNTRTLVSADTCPAELQRLSCITELQDIVGAG